MKRYICIISMIAVMAAAFVSCLHEYPDTQTPADVLVEFSFELSEDMPELKDAYNSPETALSGEDYDFRYQVRAYRKLPTGGYAKEPLYGFTFYKDDVQDLRYRQTIAVQEGSYRLLVWVDYVKNASEEDLYYDTKDFSRIELLGEDHVANTVAKDVFIGEADIEAVRFGSYAEPVKALIELSRPVGKYVIISEDLEEFKKQQLSAGNGQIVNIQDFYAVITYRSYMPDAFNLTNGKPIDAHGGVSYKSPVIETGTNEACLGFDYVLIPEETTISISVAFYSKDGSLLTDTGTFDIDLKRGHVTKVIRKYLTGSIGGGLGIDTDFKGDNNIYLN